MVDKTLRPDWQLLVRVEVDKSRRIQCQCRGCGKTVYADIHIIRWPDGAIACWGSRCFEREMGIAGKKLEAVYSRVNGRRLTDEERDLLDANREALIAQIKGMEEEIIQTEKRREQALSTVEMAKSVGGTRKDIGNPIQKPQVTSTPEMQPTTHLVHFDDRSHKFTIRFCNEAGEVLKQLYRGDEQFCRRFIEAEIEKYPVGTTAEITVTKTRQVVYQKRKI